MSLAYQEPDNKEVEVALKTEQPRQTPRSHLGHSVTLSPDPLALNSFLFRLRSPTYHERLYQGRYAVRYLDYRLMLSKSRYSSSIAVAGCCAQDSASVDLQGRDGQESVLLCYQNP